MEPSDRQELLRVFGDNIKRHRLALDLSQERLAFNAGLDRTYVASAERGERNVSVVNIVRLAGALGITPSSLLDEIHPSTSSQER